MRISDWSSDVCSSDLGRRLDALSRASAHPRPAGGGGVTDAKTILLVEDDPAIALIIRETLATECGRLASVASIAERNAWLADNRPDLIITDVVLPDGDGIDSLPGVGVDRSEEHTSELQSLMRN